MREASAAAWILASMMCAVPASAEGRDVLETIHKFFEAFNSGDAPAVAELWHANAISITLGGMISDKARLGEEIATALKLGVKFEHKIDRTDGDDSIAWAAGSYTVTIPSKTGGTIQRNGNFLHILKREAGAWKLQAVSFTRTSQ
jgi:ketosteroid isomerase-like protein